MNKRVMKEIETGYKSTEFGFIYDEVAKYGDRDNCYLSFTVKAGIYIGQTHILQIKFIYGANEPYKFPLHPPNVTFITSIFHANISTNGAICLDVIKPEMWSPLYNIETIFNSILALLETPNTSSPLNGEAARMFNKESPDAFQTFCKGHYDKCLTNEKIKLLFDADKNKV